MSVSLRNKGDKADSLGTEVPQRGLGQSPGGRSGGTKSPRSGRFFVNCMCFGEIKCHEISNQRQRDLT